MINKKILSIVALAALTLSSCNKNQSMEALAPQTATSATSGLRSADLFNGKPIEKVESNITHNTTWVADSVYELNGVITVKKR